MLVMDIRRVVRWNRGATPSLTTQTVARRSGRVMGALLHVCMAMSFVTLFAQVRMASAMGELRQTAPRSVLAFTAHEGQPMLPVPTKKLGKIPRIPRRLRDGGLQPKPAPSDVAALSPPEA